MKTTLAALGITTLVLLAGTASAQGVYKWVDENGVTSYGETPPDGVEAVRTDVRFSRTDQAALQARLETQQAMTDAVQTRKDNAQKDADEKAKIDAENEEVRKQNCQLALDRQIKYDQAIRLYRPTPDGGREYLTDQELDEERMQANLAVNKWCLNR